MSHLHAEKFCFFDKNDLALSRQPHMRDTSADIISPTSSSGLATSSPYFSLADDANETNTATNKQRRSQQHKVLIPFLPSPDNIGVVSLSDGSRKLNLKGLLGGRGERVEALGIQKRHIEGLLEGGRQHKRQHFFGEGNTINISKVDLQDTEETYIPKRNISDSARLVPNPRPIEMEVAEERGGLVDPSVEDVAVVTHGSRGPKTVHDDEPPQTAPVREIKSSSSYTTNTMRRQATRRINLGLGAPRCAFVHTASTLSSTLTVTSPRPRGRMEMAGVATARVESSNSTCMSTSGPTRGRQAESFAEATGGMALSSRETSLLHKDRTEDTPTRIGKRANLNDVRGFTLASSPRAFRGSHSGGDKAVLGGRRPLLSSTRTTGSVGSGGSSPPSKEEKEENYGASVSINNKMFKGPSNEEDLSYCIGSDDRGLVGVGDAHEEYYSLSGKFAPSSTPNTRRKGFRRGRWQAGHSTSLERLDMETDELVAISRLTETSGIGLSKKHREFERKSARGRWGADDKHAISSSIGEEGRDDSDEHDDSDDVDSAMSYSSVGTVTPADSDGRRLTALSTYRTPPMPRGGTTSAVGKGASSTTVYVTANPQRLDEEALRGLNENADTLMGSDLMKNKNLKENEAENEEENGGDAKRRVSTHTVSSSVQAVRLSRASGAGTEDRITTTPPSSRRKRNKQQSETYIGTSVDRQHPVFLSSKLEDPLKSDEGFRDAPQAMRSHQERQRASDMFKRRQSFVPTSPRQGLGGVGAGDAGTKKSMFPPFVGSIMRVTSPATTHHSWASSGEDPHSTDDNVGEEKSARAASFKIVPVDALTEIEAGAARDYAEVTALAEDALASMGFVAEQKRFAEGGAYDQLPARVAYSSLHPLSLATEVALPLEVMARLAATTFNSGDGVESVSHQQASASAATTVAKATAASVVAGSPSARSSGYSPQLVATHSPTKLSSGTARRGGGKDTLRVPASSSAAPSTSLTSFSRNGCGLPAESHFSNGSEASREQFWEITLGQRLPPPAVPPPPAAATLPSLPYPSSSSFPPPAADNGDGNEKPNKAITKKTTASCGGPSEGGKGTANDSDPSPSPFFSLQPSNGTMACADAANLETMLASVKREPRPRFVREVLELEQANPPEGGKASRKLRSRSKSGRGGNTIGAVGEDDSDGEQRRGKEVLLVSGVWGRKALDCLVEAKKRKKSAAVPQRGDDKGTIILASSSTDSGEDSNGSYSDGGQPFETTDGLAITNSRKSKKYSKEKLPSPRSTRIRREQEEAIAAEEARKAQQRRAELSKLEVEIAKERDAPSSYFVGVDDGTDRDANDILKGKGTTTGRVTSADGGGVHRRVSTLLATIMGKGEGSHSQHLINGNSSSSGGLALLLGSPSFSSIFDENDPEDRKLQAIAEAKVDLLLFERGIDSQLFAVTGEDTERRTYPKFPYLSKKEKATQALIKKVMLENEKKAKAQREEEEKARKTPRPPLGLHTAAENEAVLALLEGVFDETLYGKTDDVDEDPTDLISRAALEKKRRQREKIEKARKALERSVMARKLFMNRAAFDVQDDPSNDWRKWKRSAETVALAKAEGEGDVAADAVAERMATLWAESEARHVNTVDST